MTTHAEQGLARVPPHDIAAEQCVLGGMMLSAGAIHDVIEIIRPDDHYRPAHQIIHEAVLALFGRGDPVDAITVANYLGTAGQLPRIGDATYLHTLLAAVPTAANAGYYARIVADKAVLRRLTEVGERITQYGYAADGEASELVSRAQADVFGVTAQRTAGSHSPIGDLIVPALDEMEAISVSGGRHGVPTGLIDLDTLTNGWHGGQLIVVAARPAIGKSVMAVDFAREAAFRHSLATLVFSLEMSKLEITMRILAAEAKVPLHAMRAGRLADEDWARMARRMGEISDAPLWVDDSPLTGMAEIRAKSRLLKAQHDLKFVIVDYLQLMSDPAARRDGNRAQEVGEMSRGLKLLAKELDVPVIAVSQLNRGPEQRHDKKPVLSDMRESGCLTADSRILRADTGAEVTLGELIESGERDVPVWSLDQSGRLVPRTMTHAFPSGRKEVYRVRLTSGREVQATANHPFLTYSGWQPLGDLAPGVRVAAPRHIPAPLETREMPEPEIIMLAHMIGDGSCVKRQPLRYASADPANLEAVADAAKHFGVTVAPNLNNTGCPGWRLPAPYRLARGRRNPIAAWLDELGLFGCRSYDKFIPAPVFTLPRHQAALFLRHLWATDGCAQWGEKNGLAQIYYSSSSRRLADDVASLLLRFGILSRIKAVSKTGYRINYHVRIGGAENQLRFTEEIGVHGARGISAQHAAARLRGIQGNTNLDTVPREVWDTVRAALAGRHMTHRQFSAALGTQFCGSTLWRHAPSRERLARVATILEDADLELMASNDVFWDEIASIESIGEHPVYDATVPGTHNFIANGISLHNSIEMDADVVILLHREDAYERESPRAGEADLIVAKHRNGPQGVITVAFQGHYSRFVDMARPV